MECGRAVWGNWSCLRGYKKGEALQWLLGDSIAKWWAVLAHSFAYTERTVNRSEPALDWVLAAGRRPPHSTHGPHSYHLCAFAYFIPSLKWPLGLSESHYLSRYAQFFSSLPHTYLPIQKSLNWSKWFPPLTLHCHCASVGDVVQSGGKSSGTRQKQTVSATYRFCGQEQVMGLLWASVSSYKNGNHIYHYHLLSTYYVRSTANSCNYFP